MMPARPIAVIAAARWIALSVALSIACSIALHSAYGVPPDHNDEALRKMCEEGLAASAMEYCRAQVELFSEQSGLRARWVMRQMECQCQAALLERGEAASAWSAVAQSEADYRREFPTDPRLPWLAWQLARADLLQGQQALAQWLATPAAAAQREAALQAVRRVLDRLDDVEADIKQRLPLSEPRSATAKSQAPSTELLELSVDCTLLRCEALLVRSRAYPMDSGDRAAAAADVDRIAGQMLLRAPQDWPARDELLVARATAGLEVGKRAESLETLLGILNERPVETSAGTGTAAVGSSDAERPAALPSPRARLRAGAVAIEALCADGNIQAAQEALQTLAASMSGPEVELSRMRVLLATLDQLESDERAEQLKTVVAHAAELGEKYGGYWRNRADALLVGSAASASSTSGSDSDLAEDLVAVEVRQLLAGGQTPAAIAKLRAASQNAHVAGHHDAALDLAMQAAALLQREKEWLAAADVLIPIADASADAAAAPAAYALAAWSLAQALQAKPRGAELPARYERTLQVQLERWPEAPQSLKAEEYLASWLGQKKRFEDLANMWAQRAEHAQQPETTARALHRWLDTLLGKVPLAQVPSQRARIVQAVRDGKFAARPRLAEVIALAATMLTDPLTQTEAETLTGLKVPPHAADESPDQGALLSALLALAAARRGDAAACRNSMSLLESEQLSKTVTLAWTKAMVEAIDEQPAAQIAPWSDVAAVLPWPEEAESKRPPALQVIGLRVRMLRGRGGPDSQTALQEIKRIADQHSRDPQLQLAYASALVQSDTQRFDEAVRILKRIALGTSKNSESYLRARWLEIRWRIGRGETDAASQIAALTLSSHEIEPAWWKTRFEAVAK